MQVRAREEPFLVPAEAWAHARQAQLFHQVRMSVVDMDHLEKNTLFTCNAMLRNGICSDSKLFTDKDPDL